MNPRLRQWHKLDFVDPGAVLRAMRGVQLQIALDPGIPPQIRNLRTRELRRHAETRQAALFCYGISRSLGISVDFCHAEADDYDAVARFQREGSTHYVPLQLKEFPPHSVSEHIELQKELDKLQKYTDSEDLIVVYYLNRAFRLEPGALTTPPTSIREVWLVGATSSTQDEWILIGNVMSSKAGAYPFRYPEA